MKRAPRGGETWDKRLRAEVDMGRVATQMLPSLPGSLQPPRREGCGTTHLGPPLRQPQDSLQLQTRQWLTQLNLK